MNDDQITALAREYAEEVYRNAHKEMEVLPNCLSNEAINIFAEDMEHKVQWLLRRYCLVEKSKVAIKYKNAKRLEEDATAFGFEKHRNNAIVIKSLIESLFPEIAKEVEG